MPPWPYGRGRMISLRTAAARLASSRFLLIRGRGPVSSGKATHLQQASRNQARRSVWRRDNRRHQESCSLLGSEQVIGERTDSNDCCDGERQVEGQDKE